MKNTSVHKLMHLIERLENIEGTVWRMGESSDDIREAIAILKELVEEDEPR